MGQLLEQFYGALWLTLLFGGYVAAPALLVWGWVRWIKSTKPLTLWSILSLIGFLFASASGLCALLLFLYVREHGSGMHHFDDRVFMGLFQLGRLLSRIAIAFGIAGVWRPNPLRWLAPGSAAATIMFWLFTGGD
jgi:hypothetical protein